MNALNDNYVFKILTMESFLINLMFSVQYKAQSAGKLYLATETVLAHNNIEKKRKTHNKN